MNCSNPRVSVIIPVFNVEKYIARCLDSVVNQTLRDIEIIVVNDATPDNSMEIVREYATKDDRIIIIENEHNRGLMATRRVGYMASTGDYLTFVDSDDWLPENAVEVLYNKAIETEVDLVVGGALHVGQDGKRGRVLLGRMRFGNDRLGLYKAVINRELIHNLWSKLYKRSIWQEYDYTTFENCIFSEDAGAFFQYIAHCSSWALVDDIVYYYFTNLESATFNVTLYSFECSCKTALIQENLLKQYHELDEDRRRYFTKYFFWSRLQKERYEILNKYGLQEYVSLKFIWRYVPLVPRVKFIIKLGLKMGSNQRAHRTLM